MFADLKAFIKGSPLFLPLRKARLDWRAHHGGHPDWRDLIGDDEADWRRAVEAAKDGPRVLIATSVGLHFGVSAIETLLAVALTLRGAAVSVLLCDAALPACMVCQSTWYPDRSEFIRRGPADLFCNSCFSPAAAVYGYLGLPVIRYGDLISPADREAARRLAADPAAAHGCIRGVPIWEHALAGALRFVARGDLEGEPRGDAIIGRFVEASALTAAAVSNLLDRETFTAAVFHHGIYVPQGPIGETLRRRGVPVVNWNPAYRSRTFIFSHGETYHRELISEPVDAWETMDWTPEHEASIMEYLESRAEGRRDWISFHRHSLADPAAIARATGCDFTRRPTIGLLTNVVWDAQLHYPANAFPSMQDWVFRTVEWFRGRPDMQLLIRVHPAELTGNLVSRQQVVPELQRRFPVMPENVTVIPPDSPVSTYAAMEQCNAVLIYGTKAGLELACRGVPVIVAGEAWIRSKGISIDVASADDYVRTLARLPLARRMDEATVARARRYAFHFFFRRMIPLGVVEPVPVFPPYRLTFAGGLDRLRPGRDAGLDIVCDGILAGRPFVYPAERLSPAEA